MGKNAQLKQIYFIMRWSVAACSAVALIVALILMGFSVYQWWTMKDVHSGQDAGVPGLETISFSKILMVYYMLMAVSCFVAIANTFGLCGTFSERETCILIYACLLALLTIGIIVFIALFGKFEQDITTELESWMEQYMKEFYGVGKFVNKLFDAAIEGGQANGCCSYVTHQINGTNGNPDSPAAHFIVLYWMETTQFGASQLQGNKKSEFDLVPPSCCKTEGCNIKGKEQEYMKWDTTLETRFTEAIHVAPCKGNLAGLVFAEYKGIILGVSITVAVLIVACMVMAFLIRFWLMPQLDKTLENSR